MCWLCKEAKSAQKKGLNSSKGLNKELKEDISKYFNARNQGAKPDTLVRKAEDIKFRVQEYKGNDPWILKFKNGDVVTNSYGKKLYFKFG